MKTMVILAVLCASLLVMTGGGFAAVCSCPGGYLQCYSVDGTDLNDSTNNFTQQSWQICSNGSSIPHICIMGNPVQKLVLFYGGLNFEMIGYDSGSVGTHLTFHGDGNFNGLYSDYSNFPTTVHRYKVHGVWQECF
jgi:hypothetical protein